MRRILIADDDLGILEAMETLLSRRYDVVTARNGEEALERMSEGPVDLVILDLLMPLVDGESALIRLRESGFRGGVIVMSAHADRIGRTRAIGRRRFPGEAVRVSRARALDRAPPPARGGRRAVLQDFFRRTLGAGSLSPRGDWHVDCET